MSEERYNVIFVPIEDLTSHPAQDRIPQMPDDHPRFQGWVTSIRERGVDKPLEITASRLVVDGRHRLRAARLAGKTEVPCRIVPDEDVLKIIASSKIHQQLLNKSQMAWIALPLAAEAADSGKKLPKNIKGKSLAFNKNGNLKAFAKNTGISYAYLKFALQLERLFVENEEAIEAWKTKFEDESIYDLYMDVPLGDAWNVWREDFVKGVSNLNSKLLKDNFWLHDYRDDLEKTPPPIHQRSEWLGKIFDEDKPVNIAQAVKGVKGQNKTKDKGRRDVIEDDPVDIRNDMEHRIRVWGSVLRKWDGLTDNGREAIANRIAVECAGFPDRVREVIKERLFG